MEDPAHNDGPSPDAGTLSPADFDANIYSGLMRGDREAWFAFYDHYGGRLDRFFEKNNVYNENDREDLLQETMEVLFGALSTYNPELGSLRKWVYGVARNIMLQAQRVYSETYDKEEQVADIPQNRASLKASDPFEGDDEAKDPRLSKLREALGSLGEKYQEILALRSSQTATWEELAQDLGIGVSAAKMRYSRAIRKLKEAMETKNH